MTKEEQVRIHLSKIRFTATPVRIWSISDIVLDVQEELDAIKDLLQPEPETLVSSVLRLTDLCNTLEKENHTLKQERDRLQNEVSYRRVFNRSKRWERLTRDAVAVLKKEVARQNVLLEQAESLQADLDVANRTIATLKMRVDRKDACLNRAMEEMQRIKLSLELNPSKLLEENRKLNREYALQKKYLKILEREVRNYSRRLTWWSKLQDKK